MSDTHSLRVPIVDGAAVKDRGRALRPAWPRPPVPPGALAPPSGRRSLVTGDAGFIGRHLVRQLIERGDRVRVLDVAGGADGLGPDVEFVQGSVCDPSAVAAALSGVDRLYHLAGNPNLWAPDKSAFMKQNYEGTRVVLAEASRADLERIVFTSTESILKSHRHNTPGPITDSVPRLELDDMPGPYCRSKLLADREAEAAVAGGLPLVIVHPTLPVGGGDWRLTPPTKMILGFLSGAHPAYLECMLNLVAVEDVAAGHILAADRGEPGERYILGGENMMLSQILALLEEITGRPMPKFRVPYGVAWAVGAISELIADHITGKSPVAPLDGVRLARMPPASDGNKALEKLDLPRTPILTALERAVSWLLGNGFVDGSRGKARG